MKINNKEKKKKKEEKSQVYLTSRSTREPGWRGENVLKIVEIE